jgi:hypothetical protein
VLRVNQAELAESFDDLYSRLNPQRRQQGVRSRSADEQNSGESGNGRDALDDPINRTKYIPPFTSEISVSVRCHDGDYLKAPSLR